MFPYCFRNIQASYAYKKPDVDVYWRRRQRAPDCADVFALLRRMAANEYEIEIDIIFLNHSKNHRGHREHRDEPTLLCALCVLCG